MLINYVTSSSILLPYLHLTHYQIQLRPNHSLTHLLLCFFRIWNWSIWYSTISWNMSTISLRVDILLNAIHIIMRKSLLSPIFIRSTISIIISLSLLSWSYNLILRYIYSLNKWLCFSCLKHILAFLSLP